MHNPDVEEAAEAVENTKTEHMARHGSRTTRINSLKKGAEHGANIMVENFLKNEKATELAFNMFLRVKHPSQICVTNTATQEHQQALLILSQTGKNFGKRQRLEGSEILPPLPIDVFKANLKPITANSKKRCYHQGM